jgi:hypothetical protein
MIELAFTADETVELHLHGYDRHLTVRAGEEAVMRLDAKVAGRFAIEAHRFEEPAGGPPSRGHDDAAALAQAQKLASPAKDVDGGLIYVE